MKLKVLGSSSKGNSYVITSDTEALIIEAGIDFKEVQKALDWNIAKVAACLITHEHGDHAGKVNEVLSARIPVFASSGTIEAMKITSVRKPQPCFEGVPFKVGRFEIIPFETRHDSAEPLGFYINHPETGTFLFATDTYYLPFTFEGLNNIIIECNYQQEILDRNIEKGRLPRALRKRTMKSHMSLENCITTLQANDLTAVNNIVLIHLSDGNSDSALFKREVNMTTGKTVHIARPGLEINLTKTPF